MIGASQDLAHLDLATIDPIWRTRRGARGRARRALVHALAAVGVLALASLGLAAVLPPRFGLELFGWF